MRMWIYSASMLLILAGCQHQASDAQNSSQNTNSTPSNSASLAMSSKKTLSAKQILDQSQAQSQDLETRTWTGSLGEPGDPGYLVVLPTIEVTAEHVGEDKTSN